MVILIGQLSDKSLDNSDNLRIERKDGVIVDLKRKIKILETVREKSKESSEVRVKDVIKFPRNEKEYETIYKTLRKLIYQGWLERVGWGKIRLSSIAIKYLQKYGTFENKNGSIYLNAKERFERYLRGRELQKLRFISDICQKVV